MKTLEQAFHKRWCVTWDVWCRRAAFWQ